MRSSLLTHAYQFECCFVRVHHFHIICYYSRQERQGRLDEIRRKYGTYASYIKPIDSIIIILNNRASTH